MKRYSAARKEKLVARIVAGRAKGITWAVLAETTGLHLNTVRHWHEEAISNGTDKKSVLPVTVIAEPRTSGHAAASGKEGPVLVTPQGFRVEGLTLEQLQTLLSRR